MNEGWEKDFEDSAIARKIFSDAEGRKVLFKVALADISTKQDIDLDELANSALRKHHQDVSKYQFTGSHFEPE